MNYRDKLRSYYKTRDKKNEEIKAIEQDMAKYAEGHRGSFKKKIAAIEDDKKAANREIKKSIEQEIKEARDKINAARMPSLEKIEKLKLLDYELDKQQVESLYKENKEDLFFVNELKNYCIKNRIRPDKAFETDERLLENIRMNELMFSRALNQEENNFNERMLRANLEKEI